MIEREWTGSFADARNVSFDAATSDWVMYLDADEVIVPEDAERLRALNGRVWREAFYLTETNYTGEQGDGTALTHNALRIFRNRPEYRFEGACTSRSPSICPAYLPERIEQTTRSDRAFGYLGSVRSSKEKSRRNIELLRAQQAESPPTPFLHFNLGSEYAAVDDAPAARGGVRAGVGDDSETTPRVSVYEFMPTLVARLVKGLRICGRAQRKRSSWPTEGLELLPGFTDLVFEQGVGVRCPGPCGRRDRILRALHRDGRRIGHATRHASAAGPTSRGLSLAELHPAVAATANAARELLESCLEEYPDFFGTILPYAATLLRCGDRAGRRRAGAREPGRRS